MDADGTQIFSVDLGFQADILKSCFFFYLQGAEASLLSVWIEKMQFKNCSTWRPSLPLCILYSFPPCCLFTFYPTCKSLALSYITAQSSLCQWTLKYQRGWIWLNIETGTPQHLSSKTAAVAVDFLWRAWKREGMGKRVPRCTSLVFFNFALPFLWLNAAENWTAWQSRGGCFPRSRVRMEHIPGESCVNPSIDLVRNPPDLWNTLAD